MGNAPNEEILLIENFSGININAYLIVDGVRTITTRSPISYDGIASLCCKEGHKIHAYDFLIEKETVECKKCLKKYRFGDLKFIREKMTTTDIIVKELSNSLHREGFKYTKPCLTGWAIYITIYGEDGCIDVRCYYGDFTISMNGEKRMAKTVGETMKIIKQFMWKIPITQRIQSLLKF